MGTGMLAAIGICLALSQGPGDVFYTNRREHAIPVDGAGANFREFLLYASNDQGKTWQQVGVIPGSKKAFAYYAPADGLYWLQVATVSQTGEQSPDDAAIMKSPPHLKMLVDTTKPIVRTFQAQRVGDEIAVGWEVQEANPDPGKEGISLEYRVRDELVESWKPIAIQGLKGQVSFVPGHKQPLVLRLNVRDRAGNQSYGMAEVAGTVVAAGFVAQPLVKVEEPKPVPPPVSPGDLKPLPPPLSMGDMKPLPPPMNQGDVKLPIMPPSPPGLNVPGAADPGLPKAADVVADSRTPPEPPKPAPPLPGGNVPPLPGSGPEIKPLAHAAPARKALPTLQYVNQHLVKLQYEIKRQGPSGIGGIQIWLTKDDGDSWSPYAEVKDLGGEAVQGRQERDFEFRDKFDAPFPDGVYGLILVVKNRAGLGREPRPGDAPEIRIEIDSKPPVAQLFKPSADPQNPSQLLLKWSAQDKNLGDTPIDLEYAEKRDGPWRPIETNLKNAGRYANQQVTGDFSWKIPAGTPVQVYLRLRVRDRAGNESVAVTSEPQFVDLVEPEGALLGVVPQNKR